VPCLAFQQTSPVSSVQRRLDTTFIRKAAAVEEPPVREKDLAVTSELPPVLRGIVDERAEFQMNLGKAMDTLRRDYPDILTKSPGTNLTNPRILLFFESQDVLTHHSPLFSADFSIYHDNIRVMDPSGVQLFGRKKYKNAFLIMQTLMKIFYTPQKNKLQYRMVYDFCRSTIRVSWHLELHPKIGMGVAHVDGISAYAMDATSGKIVEHRIENLLINNSPVAPPYGIFSFVQEGPHGIAVGGMCFEEECAIV
jgi:hypothetical protein